MGVMTPTLEGSCEDTIKPLASDKPPVGIQKVGAMVTALFLPGASGCASLTGCAETVHCDLQPVDLEVTYSINQVSKGCVARVSNATVEVHVLFMEFSTVSARGAGRAGRDSEVGHGPVG